MVRRPGLPAAAAADLDARRASRGHRDLIPDPDRIVHLPVTALALHPGNVRGDNLGDPDKLRELAASISEVGIQQPLTAVPVAAHLAAHPGHAALIDPAATHVILMGHRRLAAAAMAGQADVPVIVRADPSEVAADTQAQLIENYHREQLSPLQEARAFDRLRSAGMTQAVIARVLAVSQTLVSNRLALLKLPGDVQEAVDAGRLTVSEAIRPTDRPTAPPPATTTAAAGPAIFNVNNPPGSSPPQPAAEPVRPRAVPDPPPPVTRADAAAAAAATRPLPRQDRLAAQLAAALLRHAGADAVELAHEWLAAAHPALGDVDPAVWARSLGEDPDTVPGLTRAAWAVVVAADELDPDLPAAAAGQHRARLRAAGWAGHDAADGDL